MAHPVIKYLGGLIKEYTASKNLSIREFSRQVAVDYMVVYRVVSGSQKNLGFFHAKNIFRLISADNYMEILSDFYPKEVHEVSKNPELEAKSVEFQELVDYTFADLDRYRVYIFATESLGANRLAVQNEFGRIGTESLDLLIAKKAIEEKEDGTFSGFVSKISYWSEDSIKAVTRHNLQLLSLNNPGTHLRNWYVGLSETGLLRYYELHTKFLDSVTELINDRSLEGAIVVGSSVLMGPINSPSMKS